MTTRKRHRQIHARKLVRKTGVPYGAAMRLVKVMEDGSFYHNEVPELTVKEVWSDCKCCGLQYYLLEGPKGSIRIGGYYGMGEINLTR